MTTVTISPEFPIPNAKTKLTFGLEQTGTNFVRVWVTIAPPGSAFDNLIKSSKDPRNRVEIYSDNGGLDIPYEYPFDKGGKYTFVAQEYVKGSGYGGGYQGDPAGSDSEVQSGSEVTLTVYIGQKMIQQIGPPENRAEIHLWVWNDTIRQTYKLLHGEDTPCIFSQSPTPLVRSAIESEAVKTACLNLIDNTVSNAIGGLTLLMDEYCSDWNGHISSDDEHVDPDTTNSIPVSLVSDFSATVLRDFVNFALSVQRYHFSNDDQTGPGNGDYHIQSDRNRISLYTSVGTFEESYGGFADLLRTYSAHYSDILVHPLSTGDNAPPFIHPLLSLHIAFLTIIGSQNPTPPPAQSEGAQLLISAAGFKES